MLQALLLASAPIFIKFVLPLLLTAGFVLWGRAQIAIKKEIDTRVTNVAVHNFLARLDEGVDIFVRWAAQTIVNDAKDTGTFDASFAAKVKADVIDKVLAYVGPTGVALLLKFFGQSQAELAAHVDAKVEAAVHDLSIVTAPAKSASEAANQLLAAIAPPSPVVAVDLTKGGQS